jgi:uncharacterized membrane protein YbhN (UPF0104 family)
MTLDAHLPEPDEPMLRRRLTAWVGPAVAVALMLAAFDMLRRELVHHTSSEILSAVAAVSPRRIALAVGLTALNYLWLTGYDAIAVHYLKRRLRLPLLMIGAFVGYAMSHNLGWLMGGTTSRYRLYSAWGLGAVEIVKLFAILGLTYTVGICALGGLVFTTDPIPLPEHVRRLLAHAGIWLQSTFWLGPLGLAVVAFYLAACALHEPFFFRGRQLELPRLRLAALQLIVPSIDLLLYASVMYVLLPAGETISFWRFANVAVLAMGLGIASHVPGGVGVIEAVVVQLMPDADKAQLIGTLLVFRAVYYLLPLATAAALFGGHELLARQERFRAYFRLPETGDS